MGGTVTGSVTVGIVTYTPSANITLPTASTWPSAANTGVPAGTVLKRVPQDVTTAAQAGGLNKGWSWITIGGQALLNATTGAVIDSVDVNGAVYNNGGQDSRAAGGITISKSIVRGTNEGNWVATFGPGSTATDSEFGGGSDGQTIIGATGILLGNWAGTQAQSTVLRCNIHHIVQLVRQDGNTTIQDSWLHDVPMGDSGFTNAHSECIFITSGQNNRIMHNTIEGGNSACVFVQWETGNVQITGLVIDGNQFIAETHLGEQSSFGVSVENKGIGAPVNIRITNNTFSRTGWQVAAAQAPAGTVTSGNVYTDGTPVTVTNS